MGVGHHPVLRVIEHHCLTVGLLDEEAQTRPGSDENVRLGRLPWGLRGPAGDHGSWPCTWEALASVQTQGLLNPAPVCLDVPGQVPHGPADVKAGVGPAAHPALPGENPMDYAGKGRQAREAVPPEAVFVHQFHHHYIGSPLIN